MKPFHIHVLANQPTVLPCFGRKGKKQLRYCKEQDPTLLTKTGFMVGLGEMEEQIDRLMDDILATGCDILTIGQYLQPTP